MSKIRIFADGACRGNPGPGGWGAIVLLPENKVTELGGYLADTTNNQMEITAVGRALRQIESIPGEVDVHTDSAYVINGITKWVHQWKRNGYKTKDGKEVANQKFWERLEELVSNRKEKVNFIHVRGHSGIPGNERVDEIASCFAEQKKIDLYEGPSSEYKIDLFALDEDEPIAPFYLSLVGGVLKKHQTWDECTKRVHGAAGAKFKKCKSLVETKNTLKEWGLEEELTNLHIQFLEKKGKHK